MLICEIIFLRYSFHFSDYPDDNLGWRRPMEGRKAESCHGWEENCQEMREKMDLEREGK